jgi:NhaP-type Na+/H+ or K+/H+ antiporter
VTWSLAVVSSILIAFASASRRLELSVVTAAMFFLSAGFVFGNKGLGWLDRGVSTHEIRVLAEVTLTLVLFADAARIDLRAARHEYGLPARLLGVGLPLTIAAGVVAGIALLGGAAWPEAFVLAVILAPTDAALGQPVVLDARLPSRIRQGLNVESGLNDGICVPLLFIALAIAGAEKGSLSAAHAVRLVAEEIGYGVLGGLVAGAVAAIVLRVALPRGLVDGSWLQIVPVAAAALAYGIAAPLGGSGFIGAFVGGAAFNALRDDRGGEVTYLLEELGEIASAVTFVVFGAAIVGPVLGRLTWSVAGYALASLTVVRMLPVALALAGTRARPVTTAFLGWFGPRGLASIVFVVLTVERSSLPHADTIVVAVVASIVISVFAHGLSARPLTDRYVHWYRSHPEHRRPRMESVPVPHQRWRRPVAAPLVPNS